MLELTRAPSCCLLILALLLAACGGSDDGGGADAARDTSGSADAPAQPDWGVSDVTQDLPAPDLTQPDAAPPDLPPPLDTGPELPPGEGQFGEPCEGDGDCASGLCWSSDQVSVCTRPCEGSADCAPDGLLCLWIGATSPGCAPPPYTTAVACADSSACVFPTWCRADMGECELVACLWDADCGDPALICEPTLKVCQAATCESDVACKHPLHVCRDGACGEPACRHNADCGAGLRCDPAAHACVEAPPCNDEGACDLYNLTCEAGSCVTNRCAVPCSDPTDTCNPDTGICGPACAGQADCPASDTCTQPHGVCELNLPPLAVARALVDGQAVFSARLGVGAPAALDGSASLDPNGDALSWRWIVNGAPAGSALATGQPFSDQASLSFQADAPGLYNIGLWVQDAAGAWSVQDQVAIRFVP